MSTWKLFSAIGGEGFRWERAGSVLAFDAGDGGTSNLDRSHLPSMADLLVQESSKLRKEDGDEKVPMFRTGSGKSVAVKETSISRALSILGDDNVAKSGAWLDRKEDGHEKVPMFTTGSVKYVPLASIANGGDNLAKSGAWLDRKEIGDEKVPMFRTGLGKSVAVKETPIANGDDNLAKSCAWLDREEDGDKKVPMFRTGSGKSVALKETSIAKALSILGDDKAAKSGRAEFPHRNGGGAIESPMFRTRLGKPVAVNESSVTKALAIVGDDTADGSGASLRIRNGFCSSESLFQTGAGKSVHVSPAALARAKALLGLLEDEPDGFNHVKNNQPLEQEFPTVENRVTPNNHGGLDAASKMKHSLHFESNPRPGSVGTPTETKDFARKQSEVSRSTPEVPHIKFQTAGGRSLTVTTNALQRARKLLGDPDLGNFFDEDNQSITPLVGTTPCCAPSTKGNSDCASSSHGGRTNGHTSDSFVSPWQRSSKRPKSLVDSGNLGSNLIKRFDAVVSESDCRFTTNNPSTSVATVNQSPENGFGSRVNGMGRPTVRTLASTSTQSGITFTSGEKRRFEQTASVSPFKRPRSSKFISPFRNNVQHVASGLSAVSSENFSSKRVLSTRYPVHVPRMYLKEYFGAPPSASIKLERLPSRIRGIKSGNAEKYAFVDESGSETIDAEAFFQMLAESGASMQHVSKKWVSNHYRWIVWKLACYERSYQEKSTGSFLTVSNVLEELKYRYEREVNHGHRSAIKRIMDGDARACSMLVLCISAVISNSTERTDDSNNAKVELTDGWYSIGAFLDAQLTKQLTAGKLFVGQKLRIWGAELWCWDGPTSPLESNRVSLLLHMNGTYRVHWAERLGFCKGVGVPLAFGCIKRDGGPVPRTLAGITRIYPMLYKEKLSTGKSVVRNEKMENKMAQWHNQRRSALIEGFMAEYQSGADDSRNHKDSDGEGARFFRLLETTAEPELMMADMTREQLASFTEYKEKLEACRQADMEKSLEKALQDTGLGKRDVTPFMRIRLVGLTTIDYQGEHKTKEGIVTIWNPTEKQKIELAEGQICIIEGLTPSNSDSGPLYLQARGSATKWQPVTAKSYENFQPFFNPRKSVSLSNVGEIPLMSEFDIAAFVVYVGGAYTSGQQKTQWLFVTDGSISWSDSGDISDRILAISFSSPYVDENSFPLINNDLVGATVGFCNLIKRSKDLRNDIWIAEATENSFYSLNFDSPQCTHLKSASDSIGRWEKISGSLIDKLRQKISVMVDDYTC